MLLNDREKVAECFVGKFSWESLNKRTDITLKCYEIAYTALFKKFKLPNNILHTTIYFLTKTMIWIKKYRTWVVNNCHVGHQKHHNYETLAVYNSVCNIWKVIEGELLKLFVSEVLCNFKRFFEYWVGYQIVTCYLLCPHQQTTHPRQLLPYKASLLLNIFNFPQEEEYSSLDSVLRKPTIHHLNICLFLKHLQQLKH